MDCARKNWLGPEISGLELWTKLWIKFSFVFVGGEGPDKAGHTHHQGKTLVHIADSQTHIVLYHSQTHIVKCQHAAPGQPEPFVMT